VFPPGSIPGRERAAPYLRASGACLRWAVRDLSTPARRRSWPELFGSRQDWGVRSCGQAQTTSNPTGLHLPKRHDTPRPLPGSHVW